MEKYFEIERQFEALRNDENAKNMAAYMRNKFIFYGLSAPERKAIYKKFLSDERRNKSVDWEFLNKCWDNDHREFQYLVVDYLVSMQIFLKYEDIDLIERFVRTKQWWDTIDGLDRVIGNIAFIDKRVNDLMLKWSKDEDLWVRRISIDHQLLRKEKTDTDLLEKILTNNFGSSEFFINKAIGWILRDYSKTNPQWVKEFIDKNEDKMSTLSIREASKYLK